MSEYYNEKIPPAQPRRSLLHQAEAAATAIASGDLCLCLGNRSSYMWIIGVVNRVKTWDTVRPPMMA